MTAKATKKPRSTGHRTPGNTAICISLTEDLRARLKEEADKDGRKLSNYISRVLERALDGKS